MKYKDYIAEWLCYGKHNKKSDCDCVACRMQRELEAANPVFYTAAAIAKAREDGRREGILLQRSVILQAVTDGRIPSSVFSCLSDVDALLEKEGGG